ncbi:hypothetical protein SprV_0100494700 [Sparganum proliferum]
MAHYLERLIVEDGRFEIVGEVTLGLVCFRIKNDNVRTRILYERIEADGRLHLVPSYMQHPAELFFIRVAICYQFMDEELTRTSFNVISELTTEMFKRKLRRQAHRETEEIIIRISEEMGGMPSSDTSSGSWSESDTEESMSSTSLANERSSSLEGSSVSTDEEVGSTAEVEEEDASPRESLRKWALRLKIPHSHVNELLKALKPWLPDLLADARTLLGAKYVSAPSTAMVSEGSRPISKEMPKGFHQQAITRPSDD